MCTYISGINAKSSAPIHENPNMFDNNEAQ